MPGHAASWCVGYPEICPNYPSCNQPLNPASNKTFELITNLLGECTGMQPGAGLFPYQLLHLGTGLRTQDGFVSDWRDRWRRSELRLLGGLLSNPILANRARIRQQ